VVRGMRPAALLADRVPWCSLGRGSSTELTKGTTMPKTTKQNALRKSLRSCIANLGHAVELARLAAEGPEPERAARYILDTLSDLGGDLERLRIHRVAARRRSRPLTSPPRCLKLTGMPLTARRNPP
jgi:hypothetical protein